MQLENEDYDTPELVKARTELSSRQYLAYLKANSDAERGKSGYHGVAMRSNDRWQARITGVAVWGSTITHYLFLHMHRMLFPKHPVTFWCDDLIMYMMEETMAPRS